LRGAASARTRANNSSIQTVGNKIVRAEIERFDFRLLFAFADNTMIGTCETLASAGTTRDHRHSASRDP
jgi:hypothetical protein